MNIFPIFVGKSVTKIGQILGKGSGSTWPGHIALTLNPKFVRQILRKSKVKIILIAGTNGKTTTGKLVSEILKRDDKTVIQNAAGANLLNGLSSLLVNHSTLLGKISYDYLIFESDEYALSQVLEQVTPDYLICLNLFRDQLDRYGEIDSILKRWKESFLKLSDKTTLILNSDDPQIAFLGKELKTKNYYFGLENKGEFKTMHGADSIYCPECSCKLLFDTVYFSHLGIWRCPNCSFTRPKPHLSRLNYYPLLGTYNKYNALASALLAKIESINQALIYKTFTNFTPAFGRQEKLRYKGKNVQIFLSKNPTSFNESLTTVMEEKGKNLLILINDRVPDGRDVSWIWDINFEDIMEKDLNVGVAGDRAYDIALRLKYAEVFTHVGPNLKVVIDRMVNSLEKNETLYILSNYSAMLDARKILTGRKIL